MAGTARTFARRLACGLLVITTACDGEILYVGDDDRSPLVVDPSLLAQCAPAAETTRRFDSEAALKAALVGRWLRCRGQDTGALYFPGIEFTGRGEWYALEGDGVTGLVRASNPARHGFFASFGTSTLLLQFADLQSQSLVVLFDESGRKMSVVFSTTKPVDISFVRE